MSVLLIKLGLLFLIYYLPNITSCVTGCYFLAVGEAFYHSVAAEIVASLDL